MNKPKISVCLRCCAKKVKILQHVSVNAGICQFLHPYLTLFSNSQAKKKNKPKTKYVYCQGSLGFCFFKVIQMTPDNYF